MDGKRNGCEINPVGGRALNLSGWGHELPASSCKKVNKSFGFIEGTEYR